MTEILKMDKNNQYGNAMTKALPTGSVKKEKKVPTLKVFDLIIQGILDQYQIGHLFIVDMELVKKMPAKNNYF